MENNFDLKKFLVENKLTTNSRLAEEGGFYAPEYLKKTYGAKTAQEIEDDIRDNGGPNDWDYFTSLNSAEEVEDFISDLK